MTKKNSEWQRWEIGVAALSFMTGVWGQDDAPGSLARKDR